jgi:trk system potassium uptake protein
MRVIIAGAGLVGTSLAQQLLIEDHDITLIEVKPELCAQLEDKHDLMVVCGSASDPDIMALAEPDSADIFLAVTPYDEVNILACATAKQFGTPKRIARIRNTAYLDNPVFDLNWIGVTQMIDPEIAVVEAIWQFINTPGSVEAVSFENGKICLREYRVTEGMPIVGKTLKDIREKNSHENVLVMTVIRDDKAIIPTGDLVVQKNDDILAVFPEKARGAFMDMLDLSIRKTQKVVISGSTLTCFRLAQKIAGETNVIWVSSDYAYCNKVADQLENVLVMHGDTTDEDLLKDIHVENADFFVAAGDNTEHNILSSLLARAKGARETITISDQPSHNNILFRSIGIDHIINPRVTTAASIMDLIHHGRKLHELKLKELDLEAVRIMVHSGSIVGRKPLRKSWKPLAEKAIVGAIIRDEELFIPGGETILEPNDLALVITRTRSLDAVMRLFREK